MYQTCGLVSKTGQISRYIVIKFVSHRYVGAKQ